MTDLTDNSIRKPILGCIADDVTGATDLAVNLVQGGMRVVQMMNVPTPEEIAATHADAIVVALKTRSAPIVDAISKSNSAALAFQIAGIQRFFFKYCSTFDSTPAGNIGPVAEALMDLLGVKQTIFCPAFPTAGRTVYNSHLFVKGRLLSESGMENHPLTPMTDSNLVRVLGQQTKKEVAPLNHRLYDKTTSAEDLKQFFETTSPLVITDVLHDEHLGQLADAVSKMKLVTGGSGIGRFLPEAYRKLGILTSNPCQPTLPSVSGRSLILSGSCSHATNQQVAFMKQRCPSYRANVAAILTDQLNGSDAEFQDLLHWANSNDPQQPLLVYSTSEPKQVKELQQTFGTREVANAIESFLADVAESLVDKLNVSRLVLAGGETSGAIVNRLGISSLTIGPQICPGVPWTQTESPRKLAVALKSGNFGEEDFFQTALEMLP